MKLLDTSETKDHVLAYDEDEEMIMYFYNTDRYSDYVLNMLLEDWEGYVILLVGDAYRAIKLADDDEVTQQIINVINVKRKDKRTA